MTEIKSLIVEWLDKRYGVISVTKGRGTASSWRHIATKHPVPVEVRRLIEDQLVARKLCGIYWGDMDVEPSACVTWRI